MKKRFIKHILTLALSAAMSVQTAAIGLPVRPPHAGGVRVTFRKSVPAKVTLPVLMYHHVAEEGDSSATISEKLLEEHLSALKENGYEAVSFAELIDYVDGKSGLPSKPVAIVFDDGYESNVTLALPLLEKYGAKATVCVIGWSVGKTEYKDTGKPIIPHFDWDGARKLIDSGLVTIGMHTYDMHQSPDYESGTVRERAVKLDGESDEDFITALTEDYQKLSGEIERELSYVPTIFAYPHGKWDELSESTIRALGARVTMTTDAHLNEIKRGDSDSLYLLGRYTMNETVSAEELIRLISGTDDSGVSDAG